jgi:signal transduction histidine kinase
VLRLGELELIVRIIRYPVGRTQALARTENPDAIVMPIAQALTSLLDLNEVLRKAIDMAITETNADEASIWLVDDRTGDLYLEADHGIQDSTIRLMRLPVTDTLAGKVIETGQPQRASASDHAQPIKVKTGYLVNAVVYVPLSLAGVTFGVLSAAHHKPDVSFSKNDEHVLATIGEFTAIAVQNARTYQAAAAAVTRRDKVLTALSYAHAYEFKNMINAMIGYAGLLESYNTLNEDAAAIITDLSRTGDNMTRLLSELREISTFSDTPGTNPTVCNLISVAGRAVADVKALAADRSVVIDLQFSGTPYPILGDASRLYRGIHRLIEHAVRYSPDGAPVFVLVHFTDTHVSIHVHDSGPSIPAEDLSHVFERYSRGGANSEGQAGVELGLALVWAAIEAHRGRVEARASKDEGAEFVITLPATLSVSEEGSSIRETRQR